MRRVLMLFGSMLLVIGAGTLAASAADAQHGKELAQRWCADCHVVSVDQTRASADAIPFATVARQPDFSAARLAFFLLEPHPKMPNMSLSRTEASDLAAYIATMK